jgi:hypothetical protein
MEALGAGLQAQGGNVNLPFQYSDNPDLNKLQTKWISILNPIISVPLLSGVQLDDIVLKTGVNVINTTLQRMQQGWIITDIDTAITLFRSQPFNQLTLTLTASAPCTVSLWVY